MSLSSYRVVRRIDQAVIDSLQGSAVRLHMHAKLDPFDPKTPNTIRVSAMFDYIPTIIDTMSSGNTVRLYSVLLDLGAHILMWAEAVTTEESDGDGSESIPASNV